MIAEKPRKPGVNAVHRIARETQGFALRHAGGRGNAGKERNGEG